MEYACSSPSEQRWFIGRVTRFPGKDLGRLVNAHENITERKQAGISSRRLVAIVESSDDAIISKGLDSIISSWNEGAEKIFGYTAKEMIGTSIMRLIPEDRQNEEQHILEQIRRGERVEHFETLRKTKDGRSIDVSVTVSPIKDVDGKVIGVSKVARDITESRQTEELQRTSQARYQRLFEYAPDGILIANADSRYLDANASICRMLGYSRAELIGLGAADIVAQEETPHIAPALGAIKANSNYHREWQFRRKDGSIFPVEVMATMMPDGNLLGMVRDLSERRKAEADLRESEERFRQLADSIREVFWMTDADRKQMLYVSPSYETIWGRSCASLYEFPTTWLEAIHANDRERVSNSERTKLASGNYDETYRIERPDGSVRWIRDRGFPVLGPSGEILRFVGTAEDVTERRQLEEQFHQAQKMEGMGQLAGGVAHDFNNLLSIINGYSELLLLRVAADDDIRDSLNSILEAGIRAAALTRQLLTFSRKEIVVPRIVNLNSIVTGMEKMLHRIIGEDIELSTALDPLLNKVTADPGQIEQVLMNLAVNAKDAMPRGGRLTIETQNVTVDDTYVLKHYDVRPGAYSMLAVTDNGSGMDEPTKARIFEPFFTTKELGKGTGLGLSVVHGIIRQSGGHVRVYSELNSGTTFKVYLPHSETADTPSMPAADIQSMPHGSETLLLVEDEVAVRALTRHILTTCGYRVLEAVDGQDGIEVAQSYQGPIHLVVTDVVMPRLGGRGLADFIARARPDCKILFLSGYTDDTVIRHGILESAFAFLQKPFTTAGLALKVREVLDQPPRS